MKKNIQLFSLLIGGTLALQAQVGINTNTPTTTLDIQGKPTDTNVRDGVIAPRISGDQLRAKNALYSTGSYQGTIVYVTSADTAPSGQTINVTHEGYYYYDGSVWQGLSNYNSEPWIQSSTTNTRATASSTNIYRTNNVGIGNFSTTEPATSLDINVGTSNVNSDGSLVKYGFKMQDGNQLNGRFLTSDDNGNGTWKDFYVYKRIGSAPTDGITIPYYTTRETPSIRMYNSISLPPGPWEVEVNLLLDSGSTASDTNCWLRFSFTEEDPDPTISPVPTTTHDVIASPDLVSYNKQVSGSHITNDYTISTIASAGLSFYSIVNGKVIINNQTNSAKTYYLYYLSGLCHGAPRSFSSVGAAGYRENYISALRASLDYVP